MDITSYLLGKNSSGGGGGGSDLDWTALGFEKRPEAIDDGYNYAKQIKDNWIPADTLYQKFYNDKKLVYMPSVDTSTTISTEGMFYNCYALQETAFLDTKNVNRMNNMFRSCYSLVKVPLFDTSEVTNFSNMFNSCYNLKEVPQFNTSQANNFSSMFTNCNNLTTVPQLDISKATAGSQLGNMFGGCYSLTNESINNILAMCINATSYTGGKTLSNLGFDSTHQPVATIQALSNYQAFLDAGWTIGY